MDRTMIAPWKAEEKEQSEKLHKKLQGLSLLCPMTDEMLKLLSWDMFLKPNPAAFFQVMHYLFRIIDPVEFKRRFYWPITDKKSEANFRSSTVDYLKHLNEKHQLNWTNIKSYLVVMPGGMKFINFVLDLVGFVIQELIKQREKGISMEMEAEHLRDLNVQTMSKQSAFMKEYTSAYIDELRQLAARLRQNTQQIRNIFTKIARETEVDETLLLDDQFLEDFEAFNRLQCEQKISVPLERITKLEAPQCKLKEDMDQFLAKLAEQKQNKEAADNTLRSIQKFLGVAPESGNALDNSQRLNAMLSALNGISETIAEQLDANNHYDQESGEFRTKEWRELRDKLQQIELQVNDVNKHLNLRIKEQNSNVSGNAPSSATQLQHTLQNYPNTTPLRALKPPTTDIDGHTLLIKFVSTPPIKLDTLSGVRSGHVRLPLQDDFNAKQFETTCNSLLVPRSARKLKQQPEEDLTDMNSTINRSKILDPMQMLRTINKKSSQPKTFAQSNLTSLGSKWKQMQASFGFDDATPALVQTSPKANNCTPPSPFTPLNINDNTRIERLPDTSNNSLYAKKSAAVMKVLDASLNVQNLSTSPSGRLDALVPGPLIESKAAPPLILLNDVTYDSLTTQRIGNENDGNKLNQLNSSKFGDDFVEFSDNDDLQNISDSVLNDILI